MANKISTDNDSYIHFGDDTAWYDCDHHSSEELCIKQFFSDCDEAEYESADYLFLGVDALDEMPTDSDGWYAVAYDTVDEYGCITTHMKTELPLAKVKWYQSVFKTQTGFITVWDMRDGISLDFQMTQIERTQTVDVWINSCDDAVDFYQYEIEDEDFWELAESWDYEEV